MTAKATKSLNRFQRWRLRRDLRREYEAFHRHGAKLSFIPPDVKYTTDAMKNAMQGERKRIASGIDSWAKANGPYEQDVADYLIDHIVRPRHPSIDA